MTNIYRLGLTYDLCNCHIYIGNDDVDDVSRQVNALEMLKALLEKKDLCYATSMKNTIYVFIFVGVNFCGFHGHLVIHENNIFVNPQAIFTL